MNALQALQISMEEMKLLSIGECRILPAMMKRITSVDEKPFKVEAACWLWYDFSQVILKQNLMRN